MVKVKLFADNLDNDKSMGGQIWLSMLIDLFKMKDKVSFVLIIDNPIIVIIVFTLEVNAKQDESIA